MSNLARHLDVVDLMPMLLAPPFVDSAISSEATRRRHTRSRRPGSQKVAMTLALGLGALILTLSAAAVGTMVRFSAVSEQNSATTRAAFERLLDAERLRGSVQESVATGRGYLLTSNKDRLERLRRNEAEVERLLARVAGGTNPETIESLGLRQAHDRYQERLGQAVAASIAGASTDEVAAFFERELIPTHRQMDRAIDAFVAGQQQAMADLRAEMKSARSHAWLVAMLTLAAASLVGVFLAVVMGRHLARVYRREHQFREAAEKASAAREEMLAIVGHDLRNPLSAIALRASSLRSRAGSERAFKHGEAIARIVASTERLLHTILDIANVDAGRLRLSVTDCDVEDLFREVHEVFDGVAEVKSLRLVCQNGTATGCVIRGDRERLFQVLSNLVGNAIKFAPAASTVRVEANLAFGRVSFSVTDAGVGIAPEHLPFIFERFWSGRSAGNVGTGLGLYIAKKIVEAHGGDVSVRSELGHGTTVGFNLPLTL
jgi:signal transduction histidine kinase